MSTLASPTSTNVENSVLGSVTPRLATPPLRELTPDTSFGFDVVDYARDVCGQPLDPWQEFAVIHAGELLPNGLPRFRIVLIIVSRQEGKTELVKVVTSWWLHVDLPGHPVSALRSPTVLGTSSKLEYAAESWRNLVTMTYAVPELAEECGPRRRAVREANGEQHLVTLHGTRYKIAAANEDAGRSLTICRLVLDELRQHHTWECWGAATPTTSSIPDAQIWCLSNAGTDRSVVLNSLRDQAVAAIAEGRTDDTDVCLLEWSAPEGSDPEDVHALAMAKPNLGRRTPVGPLLAAGRRAKAAGGEELAKHMMEHLCIRQRSSNPAVDPTAWANCAKPAKIDLAGLRARLALVFDLSPDGLHIAVVAAALLDSGTVQVDPVKAWTGPLCTRDFRAEFPALVRKVRPRALGWLPNGPSAAVAADLAERRGWPPPGVALHPITSEDAAVCMGFADLVLAGQLEHPDSPLMNLHVESAQKLWRGDRWVFARRDQAPVNCAYAAAGAAHIARTLSPSPGKPRLVFPK